MTARALETLSPADCRGLAESARVGRIVYVDHDGPLAIPVNFALVGDDVVVRVEMGAGVRRHIGASAAFEVDRIESAEHIGWSVLFRGSIEEVAMEEVPALIDAAGHRCPKPWAAGVHNSWIRLRVHSVTGRRLNAPVDAIVF